MADYATKQGDTDPIEAELISDHAATWTLDGTTYITVTNSKGVKIVDRGICQIIDAAKHYVRYRWTAAQTNQVPNLLYNLEFENIDSQGVIRTFPSGKDDDPDYVEMQILKQLS